MKLLVWIIVKWTLFKCRFYGHPTIPTGRKGILLVEEYCPRCKRMFISNKEHGNTLLPYMPEVEQYLTK